MAAASEAEQWFDSAFGLAHHPERAKRVEGLFRKQRVGRARHSAAAMMAAASEVRFRSADHQGRRGVPEPAGSRPLTGFFLLSFQHKVTAHSL